MPSPEEDSQEERNKTLVRELIEEIFNKHNLSSIGALVSGSKEIQLAQ